MAERPTEQAASGYPAAAPAAAATGDKCPIFAKAEACKAEGNAHVKEQRFQRGQFCYSEAIEHLFTDGDDDDDVSDTTATSASTVGLKEGDEVTATSGSMAGKVGKLKSLADDQGDLKVDFAGNVIFLQRESLIKVEVKQLYVICLSNRAHCHIKLENFGSAIQDTTMAVALDENFSKGFHRRGLANIQLSKFKEAKADFKKAAVLNPKDKLSRDLLKQCEKEIVAARFAKAIATEESDPLWQRLDLNSFGVDSSYEGPRLCQPITTEFLAALSEWQKDQKILDKKSAYELCMAALLIFKEDRSLVHIDVPPGTEFTVCGDVHGQYYDLLNIFKINGLPSETNPYLFNGDFVDRGSFSMECILLLFAYKVAYPKHFYLARGNHETKAMNKLYGFSGEVTAKYDERLYDLFSEAFCYLPLGHVIGRQIFVVHGGLFSKDDVSIVDLAKINRNGEPPDSGEFVEMLWSDPQPMLGRAPSKRGVGLTFGPDVTKNFLEKNNLKMVVRSHEMKELGYELEHDGKLCTVFSAPNYCDQMGNKGAYIRFKADETGDLTPSYNSFDAVPHPEVRPMQYANPALFGGMR